MAEDTSVCGIALKQQQLNWIQADGDENDSDRVMNRWGFVCLFNNLRDCWHKEFCNCSGSAQYVRCCCNENTSTPIYFQRHKLFGCQLNEENLFSFLLGLQSKVESSSTLLQFTFTCHFQSCYFCFQRDINAQAMNSEPVLFCSQSTLIPELWHLVSLKKIWKPHPFIIRKMPLLCVIYKSVLFFHWTSDILLGK